MVAILSNKRQQRYSNYGQVLAMEDKPLLAVAMARLILVSLARQRRLLLLKHISSTTTIMHSLQVLSSCNLGISCRLRCFFMPHEVFKWNLYSWPNVSTVSSSSEA
ncbi:hypothetical protein GCK32_021005 [Trichostrongylus colubriformis]|uniref:Uncharacterized protein n=2 Tax=Trichostrongylus colubriformis TaxID=6319 RepID=A0AAN8GAB4_TRICO